MLVVLALIPVLFPVYWLFISALQSPLSIISIPPKLFPHDFSSYFVSKVFSQFGIGRYLFNSVFLSVSSTLLTLFVACFAAFSYTVYRYTMRETFSKLVLFVYMFPQILIIIPIYLLLSKVGLINTFAGVMLCYIAFELPICIWTMQSYFETIPRDLVDAAEIDGLTRIGTLWYVFLPVALPGLAAAGIMTFIGIGNNFIRATTLLIDASKKTLPVIVADFASRDNMMQGDVLAASLVVCIPSFFFALFAQKYLVGGLTSGAVKA
jgi:ABC-type glycerol-3-phosphate transport system permease component